MKRLLIAFGGSENMNCLSNLLSLIELLELVFDIKSSSFAVQFRFKLDT